MPACSSRSWPATRFPVGSYAVTLIVAHVYLDLGLRTLGRRRSSAPSWLVLRRAVAMSSQVRGPMSPRCGAGRQRSTAATASTVARRCGSPTPIFPGPHPAGGPHLSEPPGQASGISMFSVPVSTSESRSGRSPPMGAEVNEVFFTDCEIGPGAPGRHRGGGWSPADRKPQHRASIVGSLALGQARRLQGHPRATSRPVSSSGDRSAPSKPWSHPAGRVGHRDRMHPAAGVMTLRSASTNGRQAG